MSSSAEAIASIHEHVATHGENLLLSQVLRDGTDQPAGIGLDRITDVKVGDLDERVFPHGVLAGRLSCRAVLLEPPVSQRFIGVPDVAGVCYLRTRLQYQETGLGSLTDNSKALTVGGDATHVAALSLAPGDAELLDEYYAQLAAREADGNNAGQSDDQSFQAMPNMPALHAHYGLETPVVPNFKGSRVADRELCRLEQRRRGFAALQREYPAARVLSVSSQGYVSRDELSAWAGAFTS